MPFLRKGIRESSTDPILQSFRLQVSVVGTADTFLLFFHAFSLIWWPCHHLSVMVFEGVRNPFLDVNTRPCRSWNKHFVSTQKGCPYWTKTGLISLSCEMYVQRQKKKEPLVPESKNSHERKNSTSPTHPSAYTNHTMWNLVEHAPLVMAKNTNYDNWQINIRLEKLA